MGRFLQTNGRFVHSRLFQPRDLTLTGLFVHWIIHPGQKDRECLHKNALVLGAVPALTHYNGSISLMPDKLLDCCKGFIQRGNDVFDILNADGEANGIGLDVLLQELFFGKLAVGGGSRMDDQGL